MTDRIFCLQCGHQHSGPCTVGHVEILRLQRRREKIQGMRDRLKRAQRFNDVGELSVVVSDLIDMIEKE